MMPRVRAQGDDRGGGESRASVPPAAAAGGESPAQLPGTPTPTSGWGSVGRMGSGVAKAVVVATVLTILQAGAPTISGESPTWGERGERWCQAGQQGWWWGPQPAEAVLFSPDTKVPRTADVALRRAIPAINHSVKKMQNELEEVSYLLRIPQRKPYGTMGKNVREVLKVTEDDKNAILESVPTNLRAKGEEKYKRLESGLPRLLKAIDDKDPDRIRDLLASALDELAQLKLLQAPGLPFLLPAQYQDLPRLTGRATVEMKIRRAAGGIGGAQQGGGDGAFTVAAGGGPQEIATLEVVLDGYSAPLTAGNFVDLVRRKTYDGTSLRVTGNAILSDNGNEEGKAAASSSSSSSQRRRRATPLEIMPAGDFQPLYRTTLDVQDGELPVLPLSVYGAVAMAHDPESETNSSPSQFFFYLYDKRQAGLGGLSFDEGNFAVFGYVTKGREILAQLQTGDIIESAKLVAGADRLLIPMEASS